MTERCGHGGSYANRSSVRTPQGATAPWTGFTGAWPRGTLSFLRWTRSAVESGRVTAPRPTLGQLNGHVFGSTPASSAHRSQVMTVVSAGTGLRAQKPIDELPLKIPVPCPGL